MVARKKSSTRARSAPPGGGSGGSIRRLSRARLTSPQAPRTPSAARRRHIVTLASLLFGWKGAVTRTIIGGEALREASRARQKASRRGEKASRGGQKASRECHKRA